MKIKATDPHVHRMGENKASLLITDVVHQLEHSNNGFIGGQRSFSSKDPCSSETGLWRTHRFKIKGE
jgi:hypothetical protein